MKLAHRADVFMWSRFDEARNLDFHGYLLLRAGGNVLVDPLPLSAHDEAHLARLGGATWIVVTNSDHVRATAELAVRLEARVAGPRAEQATFPLPCDRWLGDDDELVPGVRVLALDGSKTPGELALVVDDTTLVCGDLVRAHVGGELTLLPDAKLADRAAARASLRRLVELPRLDAVLVGDGWPVFVGGHARLVELLERTA